MTLSELVKELKGIIKVHPEAGDETVEGRTVMGRKGNNVVVRMTDRIVLIEAVKR